LEHRRREVPHFNVTEHPSAAWTSQQIVEAFADRNAAPQSPWQNPYAERLIGSIRRDCLNHL
jgi:hypothetical protein